MRCPGLCAVRSPVRSEPDRGESPPAPKKRTFGELKTPETVAKPGRKTRAASRGFRKKVQRPEDFAAEVIPRLVELSERQKAGEIVREFDPEGGPQADEGRVSFYEVRSGESSERESAASS